MSGTLNPATSKNYFSASYFSRDVLIPSFFIVPLIFQLILFSPEIWDKIRSELLDMNVFYFLLCVYLFVSISVASTAFLFRLFSMFNKSILRLLIPYTDYEIYYNRESDEINHLFAQITSLSGGDTWGEDHGCRALTTREKINALLRLSERFFPEGYIMLARLYGFVAVSSALIMAQAFTISYFLLIGNYSNLTASIGIFASLFLMQMGFVRAAASTEMDVLRAACITMLLESGERKQRLEN